jgi:hypothetical protein
MTRALEHVQWLAGTIGPRGTGTSGEKAAADYVAGVLRQHGLPAERRTFPAVSSQNAYPLAVDVLALAAAAVYCLGGPVGRWVGALLALATAPLLWQAIRTSMSPLRALLPKVTSGSVVARLSPRGEVRREVVILAHLDTNRCRLAWQSSAVRWLEPLTALTLGVLAAWGLLYLAGALLGGPAWVIWLSLIPAAYVAGTMATLVKDERAPFSCGAHDNAASVAVALEVAARLTAEPMHGTRTWLAFTGAEESDHAGLYALLGEHGPLLSRACFIGLEGLGSGELVYLTRQGLCTYYRPDPGLLALAERAASRRPELSARAAQMIMEDEVGTLRRAGYRAICVAGRDPVTGTLPRWHRVDDIAETVSAAFMAGAAEFVLALLKELDGEVE